MGGNQCGGSVSFCSVWQWKQFWVWLGFWPGKGLHLCISPLHAGTVLCLLLSVDNNYILAGHPRSGCPARLRGHKGSGLWKVWTVPSPPLPSPPLPSPPLPSPPLPSPPLPSLPPACQIWSSWVQPFGRNYSPPKRASVAPPWRSASGHEGFPPCWSSRGEKCCFENVELRELWFESGLMNGPLHTPQGRWSECHRVRNAKRPREGSSSRTASYY